MIVCDDNVRVNRWVSERMGVSGWSAAQSIGLEKAGKLVAGVVYDYFNGTNVCMHVAADGAHWLNREFLWYAFWYPFEELRCARVTGLIPETNIPSRRFAVHLGFKFETRLQKAHGSGDVIVYRMFKDECRWLGLRKKRNEQTEFSANA